ncbi:hypothetical protein BESB_020980 [Besnoitia besnoiti]|uniref:Uncharacterized protein n=1 Tax=Besnoitia besnoiti TaxID=94643 RepID=A0A2A9M959_BESBE|nr:hypothetical protein BESB_020980 [Besnoitia besnoiti]PFH32157.1 hypothetical protein BESB_020980 [Besnoitia besnoiti]
MHAAPVIVAIDLSNRPLHSNSLLGSPPISTPVEDNTPTNAAHQFDNPLQDSASREVMIRIVSGCRSPDADDIEIPGSWERLDSTVYRFTPASVWPTDCIIHVVSDGPWDEKPETSPQEPGDALDSSSSPVGTPAYCNDGAAAYGTSVSTGQLKARLHLNVDTNGTLVTDASRRQRVRPGTSPAVRMPLRSSAVLKTFFTASLSFTVTAVTSSMASAASDGLWMPIHDGGCGDQLASAHEVPPDGRLRVVFSFPIDLYILRDPKRAFLVILEHGSRAGEAAGGSSAVRFTASDCAGEHSTDVYDDIDPRSSSHLRRRKLSSLGLADEEVNLLDAWQKKTAQVEGQTLSRGECGVPPVREKANIARAAGKAERLTRCVDFTFPDPLKTDTLYRVVLLKNKRYREKHSCPYGCARRTATRRAGRGALQRRGVGSPDDKFSDLDAEPSAGAAFTPKCPYSSQPVQRVPVFLTGLRAFRFSSCEKHEATGLNISPSGEKSEGPSISRAGTTTSVKSGLADDSHIGSLSTSIENEGAQRMSYGATLTSSPKASNRLPAFAKMKYQRLRLDTLHGLPRGFDTDQFAQCLCLTEFGHPTQQLPVHVRRVGSNSLETFSPALLPRRKYHLRIRTRLCREKGVPPVDGLGVPLSDGDLYFEMEDGPVDSLASLSGAVWFPLTRDVAGKRMDAGRIRGRADAVCPTAASSHIQLRGIEKPRGADEIGDFRGAEGTAAVADEKSSSARGPAIRANGENAKQERSTGSNSYTEEPVSREEILLQALQAVEVNFYRQPALLLRPSTRTFEVSANTPTSCAAPGPGSVSSRLIPVDLTFSNPRSPAPVALIQWRKTDLAGQNSTTRSSGALVSSQRSALVGFTSLGVSVSVVATYETHSFDVPMSQAGVPVLTHQHQLYPREVQHRTAELLVDVVDLDTAWPLNNATIQLLKGSLSFFPANNKDIGGGDYSSASPLASPGDHASVEDHRAANTTQWSTNTRGFARISLPESVGPFDPLYVVITANRDALALQHQRNTTQSEAGTQETAHLSTPEATPPTNKRGQLTEERSSNRTRGHGDAERSEGSGGSRSPGLQSLLASANHAALTEKNHGGMGRGRYATGYAYVGGPYFIPLSPGRQRLEIEEAAKRKAQLFLEQQSKTQQKEPKRRQAWLDNVSAKLASFSYQRQQMQAVLISDRPAYAAGEILSLIGFITVSGANACQQKSGLSADGDREGSETPRPKHAPTASGACLPHWALDIEPTTGLNGMQKSDQQQDAPEGGDAAESSGTQRVSSGSELPLSSLYVVATFQWSDESRTQPANALFFPQQPVPVIDHRGTGHTSRVSGAPARETPASTMTSSLPEGLNFEFSPRSRDRDDEPKRSNVPSPSTTDKGASTDVRSRLSIVRHTTPHGDEEMDDALKLSATKSKEYSILKEPSASFPRQGLACSDFLVPLDEVGSFSLRVQIPFGATHRVLHTPALRVVSPLVALELMASQEGQQWKHFPGSATDKSVSTEDAEGGRKASASSSSTLLLQQKSSGSHLYETTESAEIRLSRYLPCAFESASDLSLLRKLRRRADIIPVKVISFPRPVLAASKLPSVRFMPHRLTVTPVVAPDGALTARGTLRKIGAREATGTSHRSSSTSSSASPIFIASLSLRLQRRDLREGTPKPSVTQDTFSSPSSQSPTATKSASSQSIAPAAVQVPLESPATPPLARSAGALLHARSTFERQLVRASMLAFEADGDSTAKRTMREQRTFAEEATSADGGAFPSRSQHAVEQQPENKVFADPVAEADISSKQPPPQDVCRSPCHCLEDRGGNSQWGLTSLQPGVSVSYTQRNKMFHLRLRDVPVDRETGEFAGTFDLSLLRYTCAESRKADDPQDAVLSCICGDLGVDFRIGSRLEWQAEASGGVPDEPSSRVAATSIVSRLLYKLLPISMSPLRFLPGVPFMVSAKVVPLSKAKQRYDRSKGLHDDNIELSFSLFRISLQKGTPGFDELESGNRNKEGEFTEGHGLRSCPQGVVKTRQGGGIDAEAMKRMPNVVPVQRCRAVRLQGRADVDESEGIERSCVMNTPVDSHPYLLVTEMCIKKVPSLADAGVTGSAHSGAIQEKEPLVYRREQLDGVANPPQQGQTGNEAQDAKVRQHPGEISWKTDANQQQTLRASAQRKIQTEREPDRSGVRDWGCYVDCLVLQATEKTLDTRKLAVLVDTGKRVYNAGEEFILSFLNPFGHYSAIIPRKKEDSSSSRAPSVEATRASSVESGKRHLGASKSNESMTPVPTEKSPHLPLSDEEDKRPTHPIPEKQTWQVPDINATAVLIGEARTRETLFVPSDSALHEEEGSTYADDDSVFVSISSLPHNQTTPHLRANAALLSPITNQRLSGPARNSQRQSGHAKAMGDLSWSSRLNITWLVKGAFTLTRRIPLINTAPASTADTPEDPANGKVSDEETDDVDRVGLHELSRGTGSFWDGGLRGRDRLAAIMAAEAAQKATVITVSAGPVPDACMHTSACKIRLVLIPPLSQERLPIAGLRILRSPYSDSFTEPHQRYTEAKVKAEVLSEGTDSVRKLHLREEVGLACNASVRPPEQVFGSRQHDTDWLLAEFGPFFIDQEVYVDVRKPDESPLQLPAGVLTIQTAKETTDNLARVEQGKETLASVQRQHVASEAQTTEASSDAGRSGSESASHTRSADQASVIVTATLDLGLLFKKQGRRSSMSRKPRNDSDQGPKTSGMQEHTFATEPPAFQEARHTNTHSMPPAIKQDAKEPGTPGAPSSQQVSETKPGVYNSTTASTSGCVGGHGEAEYAAVVYLILTDQRLLGLRGSPVDADSLRSPAKAFSRAQQRNARSSLHIRTHTSSSAYHNVENFVSYRGQLLTAEALQARLRFDPWIEYTEWPLRSSEHNKADLGCEFLTCMRQKYSTLLATAGFPASSNPGRGFPLTEHEAPSATELMTPSARQDSAGVHIMSVDDLSSTAITAQTSDPQHSSQHRDADDGIHSVRGFSSYLDAVDTHSSAHVLDGTAQSAVRVFRVNIQGLLKKRSDGSSLIKDDGTKQGASPTVKVSVRLPLPRPASGVYAVNVFAAIVRREMRPVPGGVWPSLGRQGKPDESPFIPAHNSKNTATCAFAGYQQVWYSTQQVLLDEATPPEAAPRDLIEGGLPRFLRHGDVAYVYMAADALVCTDWTQGSAECSGACESPPDQPVAPCPPHENKPFVRWTSNSALEVMPDKRVCSLALYPNSGQLGKENGPEPPNLRHTRVRREEEDDMDAVERRNATWQCSHALRLRANSEVASGRRHGAINEGLIILSWTPEGGSCNKHRSEAASAHRREVCLDSGRCRHEELSSPGRHALIYDEQSTFVKIPILPREYPSVFHAFHVVAPEFSNILQPHGSRTDAAAGKVIAPEDTQQKAPRDTSFQVQPRMGRQQGSRKLSDQFMHEDGTNKTQVTHGCDFVFRASPSRPSKPIKSAVGLPSKNRDASVCGPPKMKPADYEVQDGRTVFREFFPVPDALHGDEGGFFIEARMGFVDTIERRGWRLVSPYHSTLLCDEFYKLSPPFYGRSTSINFSELNGVPTSPQTSKTDASHGRRRDTNFFPPRSDRHDGRERLLLNWTEEYDSFREACASSAAETATGAPPEELPHFSTLLNIIVTRAILASLDYECGSARETEYRASSMTNSTDESAFTTVPYQQAIEGQAVRGSTAADAAGDGKDRLCENLVSQTRAAIDIAGLTALRLLPLYLQRNASCGCGDGHFLSSNGSLQNFTRRQHSFKQDASLPSGPSDDTDNHAHRGIFDESRMAGISDARLPCKGLDINLMLHAARVFRIVSRETELRKESVPRGTSHRLLHAAVRSVVNAINCHVKARARAWAENQADALLEGDERRHGSSLADWIGIELLGEIRFALGAEHRFGLPEDMERNIGYDHLVNIVLRSAATDATKLGDDALSVGNLLELHALLLSAAPTVAGFPNVERNASIAFATPDDLPSQSVGEQDRTANGPPENRVPLNKCCGKLSSEYLLSHPLQKIESPNASLNRLRASICRASIGQIEFGPQEKYATVVNTEGVSSFSKMALTLKSHALLLILWFRGASSCELPNFQLLWRIANAVADSDVAGPFLTGQAVWPKAKENFAEADGDSPRRCREENDLSFVLEALSCAHEFLYPTDTPRQPVNVRVTLSVESAPSSPVSRFGTTDDPSHDAFHRPERSEGFPFLSGPSGDDPSTTAERPSAMFPAINLTLYRTASRQGPAWSRKSISWKQIKDWQNSVPRPFEAAGRHGAGAKDEEATSAVTVYRVESTVSGPAAGLSIILSAVYRGLDRAGVDFPPARAGSFSPLLGSSMSKGINRFWQFFDKNALRCTGPLQAFANEGLREDRGGTDNGLKHMSRHGFKVKQYLCISVALEMNTPMR